MRSAMHGPNRHGCHGREVMTDSERLVRLQRLLRQVQELGQLPEQSGRVQRRLERQEVHSLGGLCLSEMMRLLKLYQIQMHRQCRP
jgi:hypothetical protein